MLKIGDGSSIRFWEDKWVMNSSDLHNQFPRLYSISTQKEALVIDVYNWQNGVITWNLLVIDVYNWQNGVITWNLSFRRVIFQWEGWSACLHVG